MNKCPCEECICLPICISRKLVTRSLEKCSTLRQYVTDTDTALKAAECLKPKWLTDPNSRRHIQIRGILVYARGFYTKAYGKVYDDRRETINYG